MGPSSHRFASQAWRLLAALAVALLGLGWAPPSRAQPGGAEANEPSGAERARAKELRAEGDDAMVALRHDDALVAYEASWALVPDPLLLYNRGRAQQALGRFSEALDLFERFRAEAPTALRDTVPRLDELIDGMRNASSTLLVSCNVAGAEVRVRERPQGTTPLGYPLRLNAGEATIRVEHEGYLPYKKTVVLPGGGSLSLDVVMKRDPRRARLVVRSTARGAMAFVDGRGIGVVPAEARVEPGEHEITVRHAELGEATTSVVIEGDERREVEVTLEEPTAFYESWWFWTGIGVVAAGVVVISVAAVSEGPADEGDIPPGTISSPLLGALTF